MKSILLFPILLFLNLNNGNLKCDDFKTGTFEFISTKNDIKYIIERNSEFQTEESYNLKSGEKISGPDFYKIKWTKDCEYNLTIDTVKSKYDDTDLYMNSKGGINIKIIKIENNCATIMTSFEGVEVESKVYKIK